MLNDIVAWIWAHGVTGRETSLSFFQPCLQFCTHECDKYIGYNFEFGMFSWYHDVRT